MSNAFAGATWFYDRVAQVNRRSHPVERYLRLAECAGATVGESLRCSVPSGDPLPRFDAHPPFVLLHPFARGQDKSLSNKVIEEFCQSLAPTRVVVVGQSHRRMHTPENCIALTRQTSLLQLLWLVRAAKCVVSVESGPIHVAAALTPNLLSIHSWTDPHRVGPYNPDAWVWKHGQLYRVAELETEKSRKRGHRYRRNYVEYEVALIRLRAYTDQMLP